MRTTLTVALPVVLLCACSSSGGDDTPSDDAGDDGSVIDGAGDDVRSDLDADAASDTAKGDAGGTDSSASDAPADVVTDAPTDSGTLASTGCGKAAASGVTTPTITVAGTGRTYVLSVPTGYDPKKPYPLVFAWHGRTDNGANMRSFSGVEPASGGKAIFVYPNGLTVTPSDPKDTGWELTAKGRDVALFDALVADLSGKLCVDGKKVFSFGFSFGGYMSNALGCFRGTSLRAIAPVAGGPSTSGCTGAVAAWLEHATDDPTVNISEGTKSRDFWIKQSGCDAAKTTPVAPDPCISYGSCGAAAPVTWCQRATGGHSWPSFAGKAIWDFFAALP